MRIVLLASIIFLNFIHATNAKNVGKNYTAEKMLKLCQREVKNENPELQSLTCTFRIQGLSAVMIENCLSIEHGYKPVKLLAASAPPSRGAAKQAFINFMTSNPDKWGLPWHVATAMALSTNFPCEK